MRLYRDLQESHPDGAGGRACVQPRRAHVELLRPAGRTGLRYVAQPRTRSITWTHESFTGKTREQLVAEGVAEALLPHKEFPGNRPSSSLLLPNLDAFRIGQLLSLFEHRTAVQGFVWGIASFDQWGVELGKVLAKSVRTQLNKSRTAGAEVEGFNPSTTAMLKRYLATSK